MSLWSDYHKERQGWETIEVESGFIAYSVADGNAWIQEFYVRPDQRGGPLAKKLADQVVKRAKEQNAKFLWAKVVMGLPGCEYSLCLNIKYGFKLAGTNGNDILLVMDLGGKDGQ